LTKSSSAMAPEIKSRQLTREQLMRRAGSKQIRGGGNYCDPHPGPSNICKCGLTYCNGYCIDVSSDEHNCGACKMQCGAYEKCCSGSCSDLTSADHCGSCGIHCSSGKACCSDSSWIGRSCVSLQSDAKNCGSCGHHCDSGKSCCGGYCINVYSNDNQNCGSCGHTCTYPKKCKSGSCRI